jgi:DNA polymerase I
MHVIAFDTETHLILTTPKKGQKKGVNFAGNVPRLVCMTTFEEGARGLYGRADGSNLLDSIVSIIEDEDAILVAHNVAFDFWVLAAFLYENGRADLVAVMIDMVQTGRITCTQVREKLLLNRQGYLSYHPIERRQPMTSLAGCYSRYARQQIEGKDGGDSWRLRYSELENTPTAQWPDAARDYALFDPQYCYEVYDAQQALAEGLGYIDGNGCIPTEILEVAASIALAFTSQGGLHAAPPRVKELAARLAEQITQSHEALVPTGLVTRAVHKKTGKVTYKKNKKLIAERIIAALGDSAEFTAPTSRFPEGQIKDGADELMKTGDPELMQLAEVANAEKLAGTYLPTLSLACITPIHCSYQSFMETSRSSATNPNIQNQPTKGGVREAYLPCPFEQGGEFVLVSCDYSAQELTTFAQNAVDLGLGTTMADAINTGRDLHSIVGAEIATLELGRPIDYDNFVVVLKGKAPEYRGLTRAMAKDYRQLAKAVNFGLPGGMGAESFVGFAAASYGVVIDLEKATMLKEAHRVAWPEVPAYFKFVPRAKEGSDYLVEHLPGGMIRKTSSFTAACNSRFQGRAAQMSKTALWFVTKGCLDPQSPLYGSRIYAFVHDEILMAVPRERAAIVAAELSHLMVEAGEIICPDVKSKAPPACAYAWYKAMEEEYDADGVLIPWVPNAQDADGNWLLIKDGQLPTGAYWSDPLEVQMGWTDHLPYPRG